MLEAFSSSHLLMPLMFLTVSSSYQIFFYTRGTRANVVQGQMQFKLFFAIN
jgi:hypothetical protein